MSGEADEAGMLTARQAAARLGVKLETLYAYVSRGALASHRPAGRRRGSRFDPSEVEALARRRRRPTSSGTLEVRLAQGLTSIEDERLCYRGLDAGQLARSRPFESVAAWFWGEERAFEGDDAFVSDWRADEHAIVVGRAAQAALPEGCTAADRIRVIVPAIATMDALRYDLAADSVRAAGRNLISAIVECLPALGPVCDQPLVLPDGAALHDTLAVRFWNRLSPERPAAGALAVLNAALVLLCDHGLAASTLAARVAASVRADPYAVVGSGLGVTSGSAHGAASAPAYRVLAEIGRAEHAVTRLAQILREDKFMPGFGHLIYSGWDPRAELLFELMRASGLDADRLATAEAVLEVIGRRAPVKPNVDFALAAFAFATGMDASAGEAIFSTARVVGWLGHAIEEYSEPPLRFRPRAQYIGPAYTGETF